MSDCNVCLGTDDFDFTWDFYSATVRRALKPHKCSECGITIKKLDRYEYFSAHGDGKFYNYHTCLPCAEMRECFACDGMYICHGQLWEEITEYLFPSMTTGCLEKLKTAEAKAYLIKKWNEWKFRTAKP